LGSLVWSGLFLLYLFYPKKRGFQVLLGTLPRGVTSEFIVYIGAAFYAPLELLAVAGFYTYFRGRKVRSDVVAN